MFAIVFIASAAIAVVARLVSVVRNDRSLTPPRSHGHEVNPHSARRFRVV